MNNNQEIESKSRRKAVKTIVGGVTALAAYNMMPVKWGTPVIEQIFLPAHAATSGENVCSKDAVTGTWDTTVSYDPEGGPTLIFNSDGTLGNTGGGESGTWSLSGGTITILTSFVEDDGARGTDNYTATFNSDCTSMSGTAIGNFEGNTYTGTFSAVKL